MYYSLWGVQIACHLARRYDGIYTAVLEFLPGDEFEIKLGSKQIKVILLGSLEEEWFSS